MPRPCAREHEPPEPDACRLCWLWLNHRGYRELWSGPGEPGRAASTCCAHLGEASGERVQCPTCNGHVQLKLFGCGVHGKCTVGKAVVGLACCATCPDYDPGEGAESTSPAVTV